MRHTVLLFIEIIIRCSTNEAKIHAAASLSPQYIYIQYEYKPKNQYKLNKSKVKDSTMCNLVVQALGSNRNCITKSEPARMPIITARYPL